LCFPSCHSNKRPSDVPGLGLTIQLPQRLPRSGQFNVSVQPVVLDSAATVCYVALRHPLADSSLSGCSRPVLLCLGNLSFEFLPFLFVTTSEVGFALF